MTQPGITAAAAVRCAALRSLGGLVPPLAGSGGRQVAAVQVWRVRAPLRGAPLRRRFGIRNGGCGPQAPREMMQKTHVSALILANKCSVILTNGKTSGMVVPVFSGKSHIYVIFVAPNLYLAQLAGRRCSCRGAARGRTSCFPARQPSPCVLELRCRSDPSSSGSVSACRRSRRHFCVFVLI